MLKSQEWFPTSARFDMCFCLSTGDLRKNSFEECLRVVVVLRDSVTHCAGSWQSVFSSLLERCEKHMSQMPKHFERDRSLSEHNPRENA